MDKLENIVLTLGRLARVDESKSRELLKKYSTMREEDIIKDLSMIAYRTFSKNGGLYNYALTLIRSINPSVCPSVSEMKETIENMHNNKVEGNMPLEENHKLVNDTLEDIMPLFNDANIDYYIVGALPCFIKTKQPLFRYHDDIDIMINEDDIEKAKELMELCGYKFYDDRFPTKERYYEMEQNKPPHTVLAQNTNNEFHLGFFCFRREKNGSITMREYNHRLDDDRVVVDVLERRTTPEGTRLRYDDEPINYRTTSFRTCTLESIYHIKEYTKRPKDINDNQKLEPFIDKNKLEELKKHKQEKVILNNVVQPYRQI